MRQKREEKMQRIKAATVVDPESMHDVVDEATMHLVDHFNPNKKDSRFYNDYCFIMSKTFLGVQRGNRSQEVVIMDNFAHGDMHQFAHDLAELMKMDPHIARFIVHAVELYGFK